MAELSDFPLRIWPGKMSTTRGVNNCLYEHIAHSQTSSMLLIQPPWLKVTVEHTKEQPRAYWGRFGYGGIEYKLKITDPAAIFRLRNLEFGEYDWPPSYLTISLTELFEDRRCHKLIAAIIEAKGA